MKKYLKVIFGVLLAQSSIAAVVYENDFNVQGDVAPGSPLSDNGWGAYVTASDTSVLDISDVVPGLGGTSKGNTAGTANSYLWIAPKGEASTDAGVESLLFSTDLGSTVSLGELGSISVNQSFDGSVADEAKGRFVIKIGTDWYASINQWVSTTEDGAPAAGGTVETLSGIDFTDGNNWLNLTAVPGDVAVGEITLGSAVGGTLTGDINTFGVYIEHGNGGDHARIDDFQVNTVDPEAYYVSLTPTNWASAAAWSDGNPATNGVNYFVTNNVILNTPAITATFPGKSLDLVGAQRVDVMVTGIDVITINPLVLDSDTLAAGVVDAGEAKIDGTISVVSNSTFSGAADNSRDLRILSAVSGSTQLELSAPTKTIYIDNAGNTFSGTWVVSGGTGEFSSADAIGSASIEVQSSGTLRILGNWAGFDSGDSLTVADSATASVDLGANDWTVSSLTIGASSAADGTYTVSQLNALGDAVFSGTGTIQVGPPPVPEILVGWELWTSTISPATIQTNGVTGVATNAGFATSQYAGSSDGTFGSLEYPAASVNPTEVTEGLRVENATEISLDFAVSNTSESPVNLGIFHFDALTKTKPGGPDTVVLEVVSGDLAIGAVATNDVPYVLATGDLADFDVDLTGLADNILDAGGSVLFRLTFLGGTPAATGSTRLDVDNVAVTKAIDTTPTEQPEINTEITGGDMIISWTESGFRLQTRPNMAFGDWLDYPGGNTSPVSIPMTNDVEFLRLVYP
jgi:hypothetical protein